MQSLIHADIFFFITSIFVTILAIGASISLYYIVLILKDLQQLSSLVRKEGEKLVHDIDGVRDALRGEGGKVKSIFDFFLGLFMQRKMNRKRSNVNIHDQQ